MGAPAVSAPARRAKPARRVSQPSKRTAAARRAHGAAAPARRATPARRAAPRRRQQTPAAGVVMFPVNAVAGTAGAVGGLADSSLVVGMTRSRAWIAALGILLGGIVALNVWGLSLSASTTGTASKIDELEQANSVLVSRIAQRSSTEKISALAASEGLDTPTPRAIEYLKASSSDASKAAKRLAGGEISVLSGLPIAPEFADPAVVAPVDPAVTDPAAVAPVTDPAVPAPVDPAVVDPAAVTPAPVDPAAAPVADPAATDLGGVTP
jgi:hypothetical protein